MIVVTGATGQLGGAVLAYLLDRLGAGQVGASVRDPDKAAGLAARGVRVRRGDFDDPSSLRHAFEGASQVLVVSSNARASNGDPVRQHRDAIEAAVAAGARRVVYTSQVAAASGSAFEPARDHAATEELLRGAGIPFTALRNGFYAAHAVAMVAGAVGRGQIAAPPDGGIAWTAHADLAEAAALILADEGRFEGPTPPLTGAEALDLAELAALASAATGTAVTRATIPDAAFVAGFVARGAPEERARMALGMFEAARRGEFATVDPTLARLIGRPPRAMRDLLAEALAPR